MKPSATERYLWEHQLKIRLRDVTAVVDALPFRAIVQQRFLIGFERDGDRKWTLIESRIKKKKINK